MLLADKRVRTIENTDIYPRLSANSTTLPISNYEKRENAKEKQIGIIPLRRNTQLFHLQLFIWLHPLCIPT